MPSVLDADLSLSMSKHKFPYRWNLSDGYPAEGIEHHKSTVLTTFACGGGSSMGYKLAGFDVIGCNEIDPEMMRLYDANHHPKHKFLEDIRTFKNGTDLPEEFYNLDILDGSPPCSVFSIAGQREDAWGKEASAKNKELVGGGTVGLEKDVSETDKYGRLLRYVYMGDLFINQELVAQGYATAVSYPPDIKYQDKFRQSEQQARSSNKGLWGTCNTASPTPKPVTNTTSGTSTGGSTGTTNTQSNTYSGGDKDCKDFSTQAEAQAYFNSKGGSASNNVDRLDGNDHDGRVCESLP